MAIPALLQNSIETFHDNALSVSNLTSFHSEIINGVISRLRLLIENLKQEVAVQRKVQNILTDIKNISANPTHKKKTVIIYNQCLVLLVSYFADTVEEIFTKCFAEASIFLEDKGNEKDEEVRLSIRELIKREFELKDYIGELVAEQRQVNFQNLGNATNGFYKYFGISIDKGNVGYNNIRAGQSFRHAIVHNGAKIDNKLIKEISLFQPRTLKQYDPIVDQTISFNLEEINLLTESMKSYLNELKIQLLSRAL